MTKLEYINQKFGSPNFVEVPKKGKQNRELTTVIFEISERLNETIEAVKKIENVRSLRKNEFVSPMCRSEKRNLKVKIGYGKKNAIMHSMLNWQMYATKSQALEYLFQMKKLLKEGELDDIIETHLRMLQELGLHANSYRTQPKLVNDKELPQLEVHENKEAA